MIPMGPITERAHRLHIHKKYDTNTAKHYKHQVRIYHILYLKCWLKKIIVQQKL